MPAKNPITANIVLTEATFVKLKKLQERPEFHGSKSNVVRTALDKLYAEVAKGEKEAAFEWPIQSTSVLIKIPITLNVDPSIDTSKLLKALHIFVDEYIMREKLRG